MEEHKAISSWRGEGIERKQAPENLRPRAIPDTWLGLQLVSPPCHTAHSCQHMFSKGGEGSRVLILPGGVWELTG